MHMNYRIQLPDHDWVVGEKHRLIPSVYGFINIKKNLLEDHKAVTYSGPTFIAIRSGKSCSSTALSHARDFNFIMNCDEFADNCKLSNGEYKPILIMTVDGGPDENPR